MDEHMAAQTTLALLVAIGVIAAFCSIKVELRRQRQGKREQRRQEQVALSLHPVYQQQRATDQAHELQSRKQLAEEYQFEQEFSLKRYTARHHVPAEMYIVGEEPGRITALPSLKAAPTAGHLLPVTQEALPYAPPFASVRPLIQPGRLVLGYSADGPVWGDVTDLLSMAFAGMPGTGKSSALLYFIAVLSLVKAQTHVIDPHGSLNEVATFLSYCDDTADLSTFLPPLYREFETRMRLWKTRRAVLDPFLVLVDELPVIARYEQKHQADDSLLDLAETIVLEGRKLNMFCILAGQSFPATVLPTLTRDNLSSRIVFNSKDMHARMAGLDKETRAMLLPLLRKAQPGTAILDVARKAEPCIVSLPLTTIEDLRAVIEDSPFSGEETAFLRKTGPITRTSVNVVNEPVKPGEWSVNTGEYSPVTVNSPTPKVNVSPEEKAQILAGAHAQLSVSGNEKVNRSQLRDALGWNNKMFPKIKQVLDLEGL